MSISKIKSTALTALTVAAILALPVFAQGQDGGGQEAAAKTSPAPAQGQAGGVQKAVAEANPAPAQEQTGSVQKAVAEANPAPAQEQAGGVQKAVAGPNPAPAQEQDGVAPPPPQGLFGGNFLFIMLAMFAIIYFFMIRPEQRKQKERQKMLSALKKGDKVLTIGGLVGVVTVIKDSTYIVKSGEGAVFEITKSAISNLLNDAKESREVLAADTPAPDVKESK